MGSRIDTQRTQTGKVTLKFFRKRMPHDDEEDNDQQLQDQLNVQEASTMCTVRRSTMPTKSKSISKCLSQDLFHQNLRLDAQNHAGFQSNRPSITRLVELDDFDFRTIEHRLGLQTSKNIAATSNR